MMHSKRHISNALIHILLALLAILWLLPIFYVILTSFRAEPGSYKSYIWPRGFTLDNYINLLTANTLINFPRWFLNTLIISFCTMIVSTLLILSVAYVMSRIQFKMRKPLMNVALVLGMFPGFMSMIAIYYILKGLGFLESGTLKQIALIMVYSGGAGLGFYIAKGFFDLIPTSLDEAAFLDGATKWDTFWQITVPLSKPIITYTLLGGFMGPWVDFIFAKVIMGNDIEHYTIAIGLWVMLEKEYVEYFYTQFYAGCVLISIPIAILFLLTQKYYVESMGGSVKG